MTRRCPNGETRQGLCPVIIHLIHKCMKRTRRTETSKYPQEKKSIEIPSVAASERGLAQTETTLVVSGLRGPDMGLTTGSKRLWKVPPKRVKAPYAKLVCHSRDTPSTTEHEKFCGNPGGPSSKAKYSSMTDSA